MSLRRKVLLAQNIIMFESQVSGVLRVLCFVGFFVFVFVLGGGLVIKYYESLTLQIAIIPSENQFLVMWGSSDAYLNN